ncbi:hypothetical protein PFISCL1PPCAC_6680, partial [Pristionchus fissidentatus]
SAMSMRPSTTGRDQPMCKKEHRLRTDYCLEIVPAAYAAEEVAEEERQLQELTRETEESIEEREKKREELEEMTEMQWSDTERVVESCINSVENDADAYSRMPPATYESTYSKERTKRNSEQNGDGDKMINNNSHGAEQIQPMQQLQQL